MTTTDAPVVRCRDCGHPMVWTDPDSEVCDQCAEHVVVEMRQLPIGPKSATWHLVQCSCGWARKYVSRYRAETMHAKHKSDTERGRSPA
jgi:hypothetical protein